MDKPTPSFPTVNPRINSFEQTLDNQKVKGRRPAPYAGIPHGKSSHQRSSQIEQLQSISPSDDFSQNLEPQWN